MNQTGIKLNTVNEQSHYRSFWRRVFAVSHLHWYWQTRTTKRQDTYKTQTNATHKMALINNNTKY